MTQNRTECVVESSPTAKPTKKPLGVLLACLFLVAICVAIRYYWGADPANADPADRNSGAASQNSNQSSRAGSTADGKQPGNRGSSAQTDDWSENGSGRPVPAVVATVNTQRITREDLARECLRHYGNEVLESMVNKHLIVQECRRQGITVTRAEVDAEIERMAKRFSIPVDQWLKMLKQERNVTPEQYANDIIWPTLALRKLAGERLTDQPRGVGQGVRDAVRRGGPRPLDRRQRSGEGEEVAGPGGGQAGAISATWPRTTPKTPPAPALKGVIQPIRKHGSYKEIEDAVFNMADGEVSPVIHAGGQYVILKREGPAARPAGAASSRLRRSWRRSSATARCTRWPKTSSSSCRTSAKIENVWNDPAKRAQMPGVAATGQRRRRSRSANWPRSASRGTARRSWKG